MIKKRTVVIGDIHGDRTWEYIVEKELFDEVVFLGDYVDSDRYKTSDILSNLKNILKFKEENWDCCHLLYGNHENSYLNKEMCSGWSNINQIMLYPTLKDAFDKKYFEIVYIDDDIIYSHAGVTYNWMHTIVGLNSPEEITFENVTLDNLSFNVYGGWEPTGDSVTQSPIWVRPRSFINDALEGYRQIVGHTTVDSAKSDNYFTFLDCMPRWYAVVEDGVIQLVETK